MKRIYGISKPQLFVLWAFGIVATFAAMEKASYAPYGSSFTLAEVLTWFIPLVLFFYTIGWRDHHKKGKGK